MAKKSLWQAVKYTLFAASAGVIQEGSFLVLYNLLLAETRYGFCYVISLALSVLWKFTLNRKYTFQSAANVPVAMLKVAAFYLVFTPASWWLGQWAVNNGGNGNLVQIITMLANFVLEFLYFKFFVFREKKR